MESHFKKVYREIRSTLREPNDTLYILHTTIGAITIARFHYHEDIGYVLLEGSDENGKPRFVGFSEAQLSTFAFELKPKSSTKPTSIGFLSNRTEDVSDVNVRS
jgi:hypothetical protein